MMPLLLEAWKRQKPIHGARLGTDHVERAGGLKGGGCGLVALGFSEEE